MITLDDIRLAQHRIKGVATRTPLIPYAQHESERQLYFKPENMQPVGAFKLRGAYNKISSLSSEEQARGIIAFSSGNHAQGVAYAARALDVRATIVMPAIAPQVKIEKTRLMGAEVVLLEHGSEEDWRMAAEEIARENGYIMVPPFNDEIIVAGQATVGLEILEDLPEVETVLVPIGGGGLISGVATALKQSRPMVNVIGVEPELAADAQASLRTGQIVEFPLEETSQTLADGMRATQIGEVPFAHIREYVDDIITVTEEEIRKAMRQLVFDARLVAEPSGVVPFAAYLYHAIELPQTKHNVVVISGGNVEAALLTEILAEDIRISHK
ncbi:threonine/serine dehydratase [Chloroflexi bacterium TSY]|nr:threonine/serine dehydratase [Chloroflexi bacterium TSY]